MIDSITRILRNNPEDWIEFSAGQNTKTNLSRFEEKNAILSIFKQALSYIYLIGIHLKFKRSFVKNRDILFFCATPNQFSVLYPITIYLPKERYSFIVPRSLKNLEQSTQSQLNYVSVNLYDVFKFFILNIVRLRYLIKLFMNEKGLLIYRGMSFFSVHFWLIYHFTLIQYSKPKLVVLANDHNAQTRSLLVVCRHLGVKTAYVQHAEVSDRFHSLDFDLSILYGQYSLDIYKRCEKRRNEGTVPPKQRLYLLSGSLRKINIPDRKGKNDKLMHIGLLIKGTDLIEDIIAYANHLAQYGVVIVRPHPNLRHQAIKAKIETECTQKVFFSNPFTESPSDFLSKLDVIISGNSTMLLEAAIAGVLPIYIDNMSAGVQDYYGFAKNNVAFKINDTLSITQKDVENALNYKCDTESVKYYINTYGSEDFGNEPKLVSQQIIDYLEGKLDDFYEFKV